LNKITIKEKPELEELLINLVLEIKILFRYAVEGIDGF
jgi:hypothetical protein